MSIGKTLVLLCGLAAGAAACSTTRMWEQRKAPTGMAPQDGVAVVLHHFSGEYSRSKENEVAGCVLDAIRKAYPTVRIVQPEEFGRPPFRALDATRGSWEELVKDKQFKERMAFLGLRYLILVSGATEQSLNVESTASVELALQGDRYTSLKASVFDAKQDLIAGDVNASASGFVAIPLFPLPPIIFRPAFTERPACKKLGEAVTIFLAGGSSRERVEPGRKTPEKVD